MRDSVDAHVQRWTTQLPWMDPVQEAIIARLAIVARHSSSSRRDLLETDGMRHWQFKILLMLRRAGRPYTASPSELAEWLGLTRGALSARLGPLERDGLIVRAVDPDDRRRVRVSLTAAGQEAFEKHASHEGSAESALLAPLTDRERCTLAALLRKVVLGIESG